MKIVELRAERFKRLSAVEISPAGDVVIISGKNGAGKSSVLDAIWLALGGAPAAKDSGTTRPVKDGEADAFVKLDLGEITVTRKWTADGGSSLTVEGAKGKKFSSPQTLLDSLVGSLSFDPLAFSRMSPKDQRKALTEAVKLDFDPDALDAKRKELYDERTAANRELKTLEARLSSMPVPKAGIPEDEENLSDLLNELKAANAEIERQAQERRKLEEMRARATALKEQIDKLRAELSSLAEQGKAQADLVDSLGECPAIADIEQRINSIQETNAVVRAAREYRTVKAMADKVRKESEALTQKMEALEQEKSQGFERAQFPVKGLAFDAEGVTFNGIPFQQCSSAEQVRIAVAVAAALNPKIRVIRIADGSLLDSASMAEIERLAKEHDMQVWIERVDESGGVGIVIEDGAVKEG
jgi:recombinational DNA repair ATPase RecF